jgi:hypothetical protein
MAWIDLAQNTSGWLLWARLWTFVFHKMLGNSWVAAQLAASEERLSSVKLVKMLGTYILLLSLLATVRLYTRVFVLQSPSSLLFFRFCI